MPGISKMGKFFYDLINKLRIRKDYKVVVKVKVGMQTQHVEQQVKAYTKREAGQLATIATAQLVQVIPVQVWKKKRK